MRLNKQSIMLPAVVITACMLLFFYKIIFLKQIPFPGDILISEYKPWQTYSFLGYVPGSYPNKAQYPDVIRQIYPWKTLVIEELKQKRLPLWNPYAFSGTPLLANFQSAPFYPLNFLYFIMDQKDAWSILIILQPLIAFVFTYLYCRTMLISIWGSIIASISYSFSLYMTVWLEYNTIGHIAAFFPAMLYAIENIRKKVTVNYLFILLSAITCSLLAGHPQVSVYAIVFSIFYVFARVKSVKNRIYAIFAMAISFGICAVQLIPGFELILNSARISHSYENMIKNILLQPWHLIMLLVPDFFGNPATRNYWLSDTYIGKVTSVGLVSLLFAIFFLFKKKKEPLQRLFLIATLCVLVFITRNPFTSIFYRLPIPFLSSSSPTLGSFILSLCIAILAGFGFDAWQKEDGTKKLKRLLFPLFVIFAVLWVGTLIFYATNCFEWCKHLSVSLRNLTYSSSVFLIASVIIVSSIFIKKEKHVYLPLIILLCLDLFFFHRKFNPFVNRPLVFPQNPLFQFLQKEGGLERFWGIGNAAIDSNFSTQYRLFSPNGYDPLYPRWYGEFIQSSFKGNIVKEFTGQTRSDAFIAPSFGKTDFTGNPYRLRILDVLSVSMILDRTENASTEKTFPGDKFSLVYEQNDWRIFKNIQAVPRTFFTTQYQIYLDDKDITQQLFSPNFNPSTTVMLTKIPIGFESAQAYTTSSVDIISYKPTEIILYGISQSPGLVFINDTYYPGWKAYVNNKETEILRANYAFRAVEVPKGEYHVRFIYMPGSFTTGLAVSVFSIIISGGYLIFVFHKRKSSL